MKCVECGTEFKPTRCDHIYCSIECRYIRSHKIAKEKKKNQIAKLNKSNFIVYEPTERDNALFPLKENIEYAIWNSVRKYLLTLKVQPTYEIVAGTIHDRTKFKKIRTISITNLIDVYNLAIENYQKNNNIAVQYFAFKIAKIINKLRKLNESDRSI